MERETSQYQSTQTGKSTNRVSTKPDLSAEDLEDMRAVLEGHKEAGGTPWAEVKANLDL